METKTNHHDSITNSDGEHTIVSIDVVAVAAALAIKTV